MSAGGGTRLFDVTRWTPITAYSLSGRSAIDPDGRMIAVVGDSGVIALTYTDRHPGIPTNAYRIAIRPDNGDLTAVSYGEVAIYHPSDRNTEPTIVPIPKYDRSRTKRVESLSLNGLRYAFTDDQAQKISLLDLSLSSTLTVPIEGNHGETLGLSFDPDGDFLACANKSKIIVWSTKNHTKVQEIQLPKGYTTTRLAVSPEGRYIAATSSRGEARLWDTRSSGHLSTPIPSADAESVSFSPDGKWLSIGSQSEIRLWNLEENKIEPRPIPLGGFSVKFSPDSSHLAAQVHEDSGTVSVWNVRDFLPEGTVRGYDVAFASPDTSRLEVAASDVFVEPYDASWALGHVCDIVHRNLNPAELKQYLPGFDYKPTCPPGASELGYSGGPELDSEGGSVMSARLGRGLGLGRSG